MALLHFNNGTDRGCEEVIPVQLKSMERSLDIMEYIALHKSAGVSEIAAVFKVDKSTASRTLAMLAKHDIVYMIPDTKKYGLSFGMLLFSYRIMASNRIINIAHPIIENLAKETNETAHICTIHNGKVFMLDQVKSDRNAFMRDNTFPGMIEPFHCSAAGKVILTGMEVTEVKFLLENFGMKEFTSRTNTSMKDLLEELDEIRDRGYALDIEEYSPRVYCIAVPVYSKDGDIHNTLGISCQRDFSKDPNHLKQMVYSLKKAAKSLQDAY